MKEQSNFDWPKYRWLDQHGEAFSAPGMEPRWTSSVKDAVGTAYSASSRVWFTCSHGILNEIYHPTIDQAQVRDMEFLVIDGEKFVHEERRCYGVRPSEQFVLDSALAGERKLAGLQRRNKDRNQIVFWNGILLSKIMMIVPQNGKSLQAIIEGRSMI
jgi:GH15 family glucan-1,4-alpha-glucosidase